MDGERSVSGMYLNFSKAFDTISYYILINKLWKCRLDEKYCKVDIGLAG